MAASAIVFTFKPGKEYPPLPLLEYAYDHCLGCDALLAGLCDATAGELADCKGRHEDPEVL